MSQSNLKKKDLKVIFIPGNGGGSPQDNWFPYIARELKKLGMGVIASEFPDNHLARESSWLPFLKNNLGADENSILIGHSSGAVAAMRFAEQRPILGSILVGCCHSDLGNEYEKLSGYFNRPWNWEAIRKNQKWIVQFASTDDKLIPIEEARFVHEQLGSEYYEFTDKGHFGGDYFKPDFPELMYALKKKLKKF